MSELADVEGRRASVHALEKRDSVAPPELARFLGDDDWRVRKDAAGAAARYLEADDVLDMLAAAVLQGEDVGLRNAAIEAFSLAPVRARAGVARVLGAAMERAEPTARKFVCAALVGGGESGAAILLREALSPDAMTASAAVEALARIDGEVATGGLVHALAGDSQVVRLAALEGLSMRAARVPLDVVHRHLGDPLLRNRALELLGLTGDAGAIPLLTRWLEEPRARISAILGLHRLASERTLEGPVGAALVAASPAFVEPAIAMVDGPDPTRAEAAAHVLVLARAPSVLAPLARLAARIELGPPVLSALRGFGGAALGPLVDAIPRLEGGAAAWALEVASELADSAPPRAVAALRSAVRHALAGSDPQLLVAAAFACTAWAEDADAARLVALGAHPDPRVAQAAGDALESLARRAPDSVEIALENEPNEALLSWSRGASALPPKMALEKLKETLSGGDGAARRAAVEALVLCDGEEAAELAGMALADEDPRVRVTAVRTLAELRTEAARPRAKETLLLALRAPDAPVRAAAVRALGSLGVDLDDATVQRLAKDDGAEVVAAMVAGVRPGDPRTAVVLEEALGNADPEVQKEVLRAAIRVGDPRAEALLVARLSHAGWDVRREAALGLSAIDAVPSAASRVVMEARLLVETDDLVRLALEDALGRGAGG